MLCRLMQLHSLGGVAMSGISTPIMSPQHYILRPAFLVTAITSVVVIELCYRMMNLASQ